MAQPGLAREADPALWPAPQVQPAEGVRASAGLAVLGQPVARVNREGDTISLVLASGSTQGVTFQAQGLPPGLTLDPATAAVTGTLGPQSVGDYYTVVTATGGAGSETIGFSWAVLDVTLPQIESPGVRVDTAGQDVSLQLKASDADSDPLTFQAYGLPAGLAIDALTGLISGRIADHRARTTYTLTVTATDGHVTGGAVFTWVVLPNL